jgi:hypothetical protein
MVQLASYRPCHWSIDQLSALPWATWAVERLQLDSKLLASRSLHLTAN